MLVHVACIQIDSVAYGAEVATALNALTADGPFVVAQIEQILDRHRCTFDLRRPELVVGYRSLIDLQHRIDREFDIISVERHPQRYGRLADRNTR